MNQTPEVSMAEQMEAYAELKRGNSAEYWSESENKWRTISPQHGLSPKLTIRRKTEPKLRPWRMSELPPMGQWWIRHVGWVPNAKSLVVGIANDGWIAFWSEIGMSGVRIDELDDYEHSVDLGKTWLPCGVFDV